MPGIRHDHEDFSNAGNEVGSISPEALQKLADEAQFKKPKEMALADKLNWSRILWILICVMTFSVIFLWFRGKSFMPVNLNMYNFIFIGIAMLLHENLARFVESVKMGSKAAFGHAISILCGDFRHYGLRLSGPVRQKITAWLTPGCGH